MPVALATIKSWLDITGTDHDALLTALEAAKRRELEALCGEPHFGAVEAGHEAILAGDGTSSFWLIDDPQSAVVVKFREAPGQTWQTVTAAELETRGRHVRWTAGNFPRGADTISATYDRGYAEDEEPPVVHQAILHMVAATWRRRKSEGIRQHAAGGGVSVTYDSDTAALIEAAVAAEARTVL